VASIARPSGLVSQEPASSPGVRPLTLTVKVVPGAPLGGVTAALAAP
jgi:hypothetical protein